MEVGLYLLLDKAYPKLDQIELRGAKTSDAKEANNIHPSLRKIALTSKLLPRRD